MERRSVDRIETSFEVVWAVGSLDGVGFIRNVSRSGVWIAGAGATPAIGARIRVVMVEVEEERDPVLVGGEVVRRSSSGFAVRFEPRCSPTVWLLLDRLAGGQQGCQPA